MSEDQAIPGEVDTQPAQEQPIDPALLEKINTLKQLVNVDNLLINGQFPGAAANAILEAQTFLKSIHAAIYGDCESHPDFARMQGQQKA
jgi:hypothetical protein